MSSVIQMPDRHGLVAAVAENVRVECARKGWKQRELDAALGMAPSTVNVRWMGGRQWQLEDLDAIAQVMRIPVDRLLLPRLDSNQEPAYRATRDLLAVQELLGHARPETTRAYVSVSADSLRAAVDAAA